MRFRLLPIVATTLVLAAIPAANAMAVSPPPTATIGPYHFQSDSFKIFSKDPTDIVMLPGLSIAPGHSNGWHVHPGPAFVIVTAGTLALYRSTDSGCNVSTYGPGQGFVETPGQVHIARNEGSTPLTVVVTFLNVPAGIGAFRTSVPAPANCPGIS